MLTHTFGYTETGDMDAVFRTIFEIVVDVKFHVFVLLGGRLDLDGRHDFLADFTMHVPAAHMSFD
jgi:hypothetical protein